MSAITFVLYMVAAWSIGTWLAILGVTIVERRRAAARRSARNSGGVA